MTVSQERSKTSRGKVAMTDGVSIHGAERISPQMLEMIADLLEFVGDSYVYSIVLNSTNGPIGKNGKPVFSAYYAGVRAIVINLQQHFNKSLETAQDDANCVSLPAIIWYNFITSALHELKHAIDLSEADNEATYQIDDDACAVAQTWAHDILIQAAAGGHIDFSMPDMTKEPFFGEQLEMVMGSILDAVESGEHEAWQGKQAMMFENNEIFNLDGGSTQSFMEYLQQLNNGKHTWTTKVEPVELSPEAENLIVKPEEQTDTGVASVGTVEANASPAPVTPSPHTLDNNVPNVASGGQVLNGAIITIITDGAETIAPENDMDESDFDDHTAPDTAVTPHNLSPEQCITILTTVVHRLHCHMFNKCGYQLGNDVAYTNPGAVLEPCFIGDIPGAVQLIVSYDTLNATGAPIKHVSIFDADDRKTTPAGHISGITSKDGTLPAFVFYINVDGHLEKRSLRAQSPVKYQEDGVTLKPWSKMLREGTMISALWRDVPDGVDMSPMMGKVLTQGGQNTVVTLHPFKPEWKKEFSFAN